MSATLQDNVVLTVEIGFSTTSGSGKVPIGSTLSTINWTDVSSYVRAVTTSRGRSSELDSFQTGSASITLSNADRRFDPEYSSGPYYGTLTPLRPVRIRAQYGAGATTNLFFGWIEQWPQTYVNPTDAVVTVTASDSFKILNLLKLPSYWQYHVQQDARVLAFVRMDDGAVSSVLDSFNNVSFGSYKTNAGASTVGVPGSSLLVNDDNASSVFDGTRYVDVPYRLQPTGVSFWISSSQTTAGSYGLVSFDSDLPSCIGMDVTAGGVGTLRFTRAQNLIPSGTIAQAYTTTVQINDGKPHHVLLNTNDPNIGGGLGIYIDGVLATLSLGSFNDFTGSRAQTGIGRKYSSLVSGSAAGVDFTSNFVGTIDEVLFYKFVSGQFVTSTDATTNYQIGAGTYLAGQRTDQRISTVLTMAEWMTDGTDLSTGSGTVQAISTQNKAPLQVAQDCEAAEQGRLFIDRDGKVKFISRNTLATTSTYNTSQYTFGDGAGELGYSSLQFEFNDRLVFNRSVVGREGGSTVTVEDATSQGQFFVRTDSVSSLIVDSDQQIIDIANARVAAYQQPRLRVEQLTFSPRQAPSSLYPVAIGVEIGTRLTVKRRPQGVGSVLSKEVVVEGISHSISPDGWETVFTLSPVFTSTFILDSSTFGVLDSNQLGF